MTEKMLFDRVSGIDHTSLDKVYHSNSMSEMQVNADLFGVDLCNPYVLLLLADTTAYHHAFWPHTAKRFTAFKDLIRRDKAVRKSLADGILLSLLKKLVDDKEKHYADIAGIASDGRKQELKNLHQLVDIVEKAVDRKQ